MNIFMYHYWYDARFINKKGGPLRFWELSDSLTRAGHTVYLFTVKDMGMPQSQTSAKVVCIPSFGIPLIGMFIFDICLLCSSLYHALRYGCNGVYARLLYSFTPLLISLFTKSPLIYDVFDDPYIRYNNHSLVGRITKLPLTKLYDAIYFKYAHAFVTFSIKVKDVLIANTNIPSDKISVLRGGSNLRLFKPIPRDTTCKKLGFNPDLRYIGFVGKYRKGNDYDVIIETAAEIKKHYSDVRFITIGDSFFSQYEIPKAKVAHCDDIFLDLGFIEYDILPEYIACMDICIAPFTKEWGDTAAIKLFDYLACGKPVVTTNFGTTSAYLDEANAIVFVEPEKPEQLTHELIGLLDNPGKRAEMGKHGRSFMERYFDRENVATAVGALFSKHAGTAHT